MKVGVVIDGALVDAANATVSIFDRGFLYGDGVSEMILAFRGRTFRRDLHLERFEKSCLAFRMSVPSREAVCAAIERALASHAFDFAAVRVMMTCGASGFGLDRDGSSLKTSLIVIAAEIAPPQKFVAPISLARSSCGFSGPRGAKASAYERTIVERMNARDRGFDDVIFVDANENVIEAGSANVIAIVDRKIVAPIDGALDGITRREILAIANRLEIAVEPRAISIRGVLTASEIFLTSTLRGIAPVARLEDATFEAPGPVTRKMQNAYFEIVSDALGVT